MRRYGPKPRTRRDREIAALLLKTVTDPAPVSEAGFAAKVDALARGFS